MVSRHPVKLLVAALTWVVLPGPAQAIEGWTPAVDAQAPVIASPDLGPEDMTWVIQKMMGAETAETLGEVSSLPVDAPAFIDPLRHELLLANLADFSAAHPPCKGLKGDLNSNLGLAQAKALELDMPGALDAQRSAQAAFECLPEPIGAGGVAQLMAIPGLVSGYKREAVEPIPTDETVRLFQDVFRLNSQARLSDEHHGDLQEAWEAARLLTSEEARVAVPLPLGDLPGLTPWIDGVAAEEERVSLTPGRHFVQLVDSNGRSRYGGTFIVGSDPASGDPTIVPLALLPPSRAELAETLTINAVSGSISPPVKAAAVKALSKGGHPWLLMATGDPGGGRLIGLILTPDGAIEQQRFEPRRPGCTTAGWLSAASGIAAIAGAAVWAPAYLDKREAINRGGAWYTEDGHTTADAQATDQRIMLGLGLGWGAAGLGAVTIGASRAAGCHDGGP